MAPSSTVVAKLKVQLKLSISRLQMVQQKDTAIAKQQRRAMGHLLEQGKEDSARIRVENIIRSDIDTELLEILELYCELLIARIGLLEAKECDPGLEEAVKSIIYAAPRTDVKELQQCRQLLVEKFGKDFALVAVDNSDGKVSDRVVKRLRVQPPSHELVTLYLKEIANTYDIDWPRQKEEPDEVAGEADDDANGGQREQPQPAALVANEPSAQNRSSRAAVLNPGPVEEATSKDATGSPMSFPKPPLAKSTVTSSEPNRPPERLGPSSPGAPTPQGPQLDDLAARFAALKRGL